MIRDRGYSSHQLPPHHPAPGVVGAVASGHCTGKDGLARQPRLYMSSFLRRYQLKQNANSFNGYSKLLKSKERLVFLPTTIKSLREGIEFFEAPDKPPNRLSEQALAASLIRFEAVMKLYGLNKSPKLPESAVEKNRVWKEQVKPRLGDAKELKDYLESNNDSIPASALQHIDEFVLNARQENKSRKKAAAEALKQSKKKEEAKKRRELGLAEEADVELAENLMEMATVALREVTREECGYMYFKVWMLPDGTCWYKIGISNNLNRRDAEQNVLPVPSKTICSVRFTSMSLARAAESAFHETLQRMRILGANNKVLFHLKPEQAQAVSSVMEQLKMAGFF